MNFMSSRSSMSSNLRDSRVSRSFTILPCTSAVSDSALFLRFDGFSMKFFGKQLPQSKRCKSSLSEHHMHGECYMQPSVCRRICRRFLQAYLFGEVKLINTNDTYISRPSYHRKCLCNNFRICPESGENVA